MATYIEGAMRAVLAGTAAVSDYVGSRIYFHKAPQQATLPCIIYFSVADPHKPLYMDIDGVKIKAGQRLMQFTCVSKQSEQGLGLQQAVLNTLRWLQGTTQSFTIEGVEIENVRQRYEPADNLYLNDVDAIVEYYET